jgi:hypothetical protein
LQHVLVKLHHATSPRQLRHLAGLGFWRQQMPTTWQHAHRAFVQCLQCQAHTKHDSRIQSTWFTCTPQVPMHMAKTVWIARPLNPTVSRLIPQVSCSHQVKIRDKKKPAQHITKTYIRNTHWGCMHSGTPTLLIVERNGNHTPYTDTLLTPAQYTQGVLRIHTKGGTHP